MIMQMLTDLNYGECSALEVKSFCTTTEPNVAKSSLKLEMEEVCNITELHLSL